MGVNAEIGKRLRTFRLNKALTQTQLASAAGRSKQLVSAWEAGRAEITVGSVARLARTMGLDPRWLLMGDRSSGTEEGRNAIVGTWMPFQSLEQILTSGADEGFREPASEVVTTYHGYPPHCFAMACPDHALMPRVRSGDLLIVDPAAPPLPNALVAVVIVADNDRPLTRPTLVVRRLRYESVHALEGPIALVAEAPGWPALSVRLGADARLLGAVVGFEANLTTTVGCPVGDVSEGNCAQAG